MKQDLSALNPFVNNQARGTLAHNQLYQGQANNISPMTAKEIQNQNNPNWGERFAQAASKNKNTAGINDQISYPSHYQVIIDQLVYYYPQPESYREP